jgi:hypothetical protein
MPYVRAGVEVTDRRSEISASVFQASLFQAIVDELRTPTHSPFPLPATPRGSVPGRFRPRYMKKAGVSVVRRGWMGLAQSTRTGTVLVQRELEVCLRGLAWFVRPVPFAEILVARKREMGAVIRPVPARNVSLERSIALPFHGGQNRLGAVAPDARLNDCHPRPVNGYVLDSSLIIRSIRRSVPHAAGSASAGRCGR